MATKTQKRGEKYNAKVHASMVEMAGKGSPNHIIARAHNIHPDTFQVWLRRGREYDEGEGDPDSLDASYAQLEEDIEQARAMLASELYETITDAGKSGLPQTWQAAATWLERRYPDDFGRHEKRSIEGQPALPNVNILVLNDPDARRAHQEILSRIAGSGDHLRPRFALGPGDDSESENGAGRE